MGRQVSVGAALAVALVLMGLATAAGAGAAVPEWGRCVKVATGSKGAYTGATCVTHATKVPGKYEWKALTSEEKDTFTGTAEEVTLSTVGRLPVKCTLANISGEYKGPKTASVKVEFQGCVNAEGKDCTGVTTPQTKSEIETLPLEGELGYVRDEEVNGRLFVQTGLLLKPTSPLTEWITYECGSPLETFALEGGVIGKLSPFDKMTTASNLVWTVSKGVQKPESFAGGANQTLKTKVTSGVPPTSTTAASTLGAKSESGTSSTEVEIKALEK
jgi:hypothetical protein